MKEHHKKEAPILSMLGMGGGGTGNAFAGASGVVFNGFNSNPAPFTINSSSVTLTPSWAPVPIANGATVVNNGGGRYVEVSVRGFQGDNSGGAGGQAGGKIYLEKDTDSYIRYASGGPSPGTYNGGSGLVFIHTSNSLPTSTPNRNTYTMLVGGGGGGRSSCSGGGGEGGGPSGGSGGGQGGSGGSQNGGGGGSPNGGAAGGTWYGGNGGTGGYCDSGSGGGGWYGGGGGGNDHGAGGHGGGGGGSGYYRTFAPQINPTSLEVTLDSLDDTGSNGVFNHGTMLTGSGTWSPTAPSQPNGSMYMRIVSS